MRPVFVFLITAVSNVFGNSLAMAIPAACKSAVYKAVEAPFGGIKFPDFDVENDYFGFTLRKTVPGLDYNNAIFCMATCSKRVIDCRTGILLRF